MSDTKVVQYGDAALLAGAGLRAEQDGAVVTISLSRPEARNAQTPSTWRVLAAMAESFEPDVRAVIIRGDGESFSAGLDRRMFTEGLPGEASLVGMAAFSQAEFSEMVHGFQAAFTCWRAMDAITVAAVQGHAVGAGFQLALGADMMIVADNVAMSMRETQLGLVPDLGGTHPLVQAVGYSRALEICATGRWVGADEAVSSGIAVASVAAADLDHAARSLVDSMLKAAPNALIETKTLLREAELRTRAEQAELERLAQHRRVGELAKMLAGEA